MAVRIRVDDFPQTKGEPQHTLAAYREFDRRLRECIGGKRYLLGVIPGRCTVDDLLFLRNETDCVVGMHGTDHDESKLDRLGGNQFEPYLTEKEVSRQLAENRSALEAAVGRPVRVYMPPRNVMDGRVQASLSTSGFDWFTGGPETPPTFRAPNCIMSVPPDEYGRTDELWNRGAHRQICLRSSHEDTVLALHWTWETNIGLTHMVKFLTAIPVQAFAHFDE